MAEKTGFFGGWDAGLGGIIDLIIILFVFQFLLGGFGGVYEK